jgi:MSHA pilin protein MshC
MMRRTANGFTLVELVMTLIIVGILAVVVLPRFADKSLFEARGFRDETLSLLRYAQKSAVAQRRKVCVVVNATGVTLTIDTTPVPDGTCDGPLTLPTTPRGSSNGGLAGSSFNFLASGATSGSGTLTLTLTNAADIKIEAATGYVR